MATSSTGMRLAPSGTPVYPDVIPFNEVYAEIYVDGATFRTNQLSLNLPSGCRCLLLIGGRYPVLIRERGRRQVGGTLVREYLDVELRKKLERSRTFGLRLLAETNILIPTTAYCRSHRPHAPSARRQPSAARRRWTRT